MAQVTHPLQGQPKTEAERIDRQLLLAFGDWRDLEEIEAWDPYDRADVVEEWPLAEMRLRDLEGYASMMTPKQKVRYGNLLELVEKNRPIIERLRGPSISFEELKRRQQPTS